MAAATRLKDAQRLGDVRKITSGTSPGAPLVLEVRCPNGPSGGVDVYHARALDAGETTASSSDDAAKTLDGPGGGRRAGATSSRGGGLGGELADLLDLDALAGMVTVRCVLPAGFEPIPNDLKLDEGVTVGALKLKVRDLLRWSGVGEAEKGGGAAASASEAKPSTSTSSSSTVLGAARKATQTTPAGAAAPAPAPAPGRGDAEYDYRERGRGGGGDGGGGGRSSSLFGDLTELADEMSGGLAGDIARGVAGLSEAMTSGVDFQAELERAAAEEERELELERERERETMTREREEEGGGGGIARRGGVVDAAAAAETRRNDDAAGDKVLKDRRSPRERGRMGTGVDGFASGGWTVSDAAPAVAAEDDDDDDDADWGSGWEGGTPRGGGDDGDDDDAFASRDAGAAPPPAPPPSAPAAASTASPPKPQPLLGGSIAEAIVHALPAAPAATTRRVLETARSRLEKLSPAAASWPPAAHVAFFVTLAALVVTTIGFPLWCTLAVAVIYARCVETERLAAEAKRERDAHRRDATRAREETTRLRAALDALSGTFYLTLVPIRPRWRGERRSLRTLPGASLRPSLAFNPRPRRLSTPSDAFQLHPDIALYGTTLRTAFRRRRRLRRPADPRAHRAAGVKPPPPSSRRRRPRRRLGVAQRVDRVRVGRVPAGLERAARRRRRRASSRGAPPARARVRDAAVVRLRPAAADVLERARDARDAARVRRRARLGAQARSVVHWSPYDRVGAVNADP